MKNSFKILVFLGVSILLTACTTGHCRGKDMSTEKIFVFKPDGSLQCSKKNGVAVDVMAEELKGIEIFSKENKYDGMMHITLCGSATGKVNVYQIRKADFEKAKALGFEEFK